MIGMNYAAVAVVLSAVFMLGFVVGVVFGRWVPENRTEVHVATLDELRTELRSVLDEPFTEEEQKNWQDGIEKAVRNFFYSELSPPPNQETPFRAILRREMELMGVDQTAKSVAAFSARIENLEVAASEFHGRLSKIEDRLSPTVATAVAPPVDFWQEYARKASGVVQEKTAGDTRDPKVALIEQAFANWDRGNFGDPNFVKTKPVDRLGFVLEKLRDRAGLTAKDAKRIGVSGWERLSEIENFSSVPTETELRAMLDAYFPPVHLLSKIWRLWGECGQVATATLPDDEEVVASVTRRELNESKAAAKLLGQLLRDARLQSNNDFPEINPRVVIEEFESGNLIPYSDSVDRMIAAYQPSREVAKRIWDAWEIAQKPYLGRVAKVNQES